MSSIFDWSLTAANNGNADSSINWQEGQLPSTVNNSAREMMKRLAEFLKDVGGTVTAGGSANALTLASNSPISAYATGQIVGFKAAASNTSAATINVNAIGAKSIRKNSPVFDSPLTGGEITDDGMYILVYDEALNGAAGGWMLLNPNYLSDPVKWRSRFIGEVVYSNTALTGAEAPPSSTTDTIWIELTAGLTGVGQFNNSKIINETVSGSAPLNTATAQISVASSPMNGQIVRLINTESRILRPSASPNTSQNDAFQGFFMGGLAADINSAATGSATALTTSTVVGASGIPNIANAKMTTIISDGSNGTPRTANETRMKNLGVKAYMRVA